MASNVMKGSSIKNVVTRSYAAQAAAATKQNNYVLPQHQPQVSKLADGGVVASLETNSPVSKIAIFVNSGARYETISNRGVAHMTRLCAGLSTQNFSAFGLTRKTQQLGGTMECQSGREHMSYSMSFLRDNLSEVFEMLSDSALHPLFHPWEVSAQSTRLLTEIHARCPTVIALEMLHEAAFRAEGLGNSLFVPDYRIGKVTPDQLQDFVKTTHTSSRLAFVGMGVEHGPLVKLARALKPESGSGLKAPSAYGGGEIRKETGGPMAYVAVAGPGARVDSNDAASLAIAQFILGTGPGTKYGSNASSKLASIVSGAGGTGTALALNANYSDGGLFGFLVAEEADKAGDVVRAVAKAIRSLKVTEEEVTNAKAKAKAAVLMSAESSENELEEMGMQALLSGKYSTPVESIAAIDKVTSASVQAALSNVNKGKPSMSAFGGISKVPYLDQL